RPGALLPARLLGGHHHEGPSVPGEGQQRQEPEGAAAVPGAGPDPPEAGHGAAQGAAGGPGRGGAREPGARGRDRGQRDAAVAGPTPKKERAPGSSGALTKGWRTPRLD